VKRSRSLERRGGRHGGDDRLQGADPGAQPGRQHLLELGQRAQRGVLDPGDRPAGRCPQSHRDGDRLVVVKQQRRHGRARPEPVPSRGAPRREHGVAKLTQLVHIIPNSPRRHPQPLGEFGSRPVARGLQQREQSEQPRGSFQHDRKLAALLGT